MFAVHARDPHTIFCRLTAFIGVRRIEPVFVQHTEQLAADV